MIPTAHLPAVIYPTVLLVLTPFDGDPVPLWLPAPLAVERELR